MVIKYTPISELDVEVTVRNELPTTVDTVMHAGFGTGDPSLV